MNIAFRLDAKKQAGIIVFQSNFSILHHRRTKNLRIKDGKEQLKESYCNIAGAPIGVWTILLSSKRPNFFRTCSNIPNYHEKLSDILSERWTIIEPCPKKTNSLPKKSLKDLILEMEDEVLANAGVDVFEEF